MNIVPGKGDQVSERVSCLPANALAMANLSVLTLNLGLLAWRPFGLRGISIDRHIDERLAAAPIHLRAIGADIIALQEVYSSRDSDYLRTSLIETHPFAFVPRRVRSLLGSGLMFLSRYPIVNAEYILQNGTLGLHHAVSEKASLSIQVNVPDYGAVRLLNVHLSAESSERSSRESQRNKDQFSHIEHILSVVRGEGQTHILLGDFNSSPDVNPEFYQRILAAGLIDAFARVAKPEEVESSVTWDSSNPMNAVGRYRNSPSQRIDHVFVSTTFAERTIPIAGRIEFSQPTIVIDAGQKVTLSDHYGLSVRFALGA